MLLIAAKALILDENLLNSVDLTLFKYINHIYGICPANLAEDLQMWWTVVQTRFIASQTKNR